MFVFDKETPTGTITHYHKVTKFELHADATHAVVNSYVRPEMDIIAWQDTYTIPAAYPITSIVDVETILTAAGAPFDGGEILNDPSEFQVAQAAVRQNLDALLKQKIWSGCPTPYGDIDSDEEAIRNVGGKCQVADRKLRNNEEWSTVWKMKNNTYPIFTASEMLEIGDALDAHISACYASYWGIKALIYAAASIEELNDVDLYSSWPPNEQNTSD